MTNCRHCKAKLKHDFVDLGYSPPSNSYRSKEEIDTPEIFFPLKVKVCEKCWLVQTQDFVQADLMFEEQYAYFSSTSKSWLQHAENYTEDIVNRLKLNKDSFVIEIASNDGYLLKNFIDRGIPCLGVEPTLGTAKVAQNLGIEVITEFFTNDLAKQLAKNNRYADLIIGNNVYAHLPDINDFTKGMKSILSSEGVITLEFPHLLNLIKFKQFDTIYHEHFSYLSLTAVSKIFDEYGLKVFDIKHIPTHGGSLRVFGCHKQSTRNIENSVSECISLEQDFGLTSLDIYQSFQTKINSIKYDFLLFLLNCAHKKKSVAGYGAAAKGNTLINYSGVKSDLINFVCDASVAKQGKYLPGSHIPILDPTALTENTPDYLLILPWNLADEVSDQLDYLRKRGTKFVTVIPELQIF